MNTSETIENISAAMVAAQAKMPAAPMNKKNPFLKNNYADLGAIIETAQPILADNHLAVSQICTSRDGYIGVETVLLHKSGEWISSYMELPLSDEKGKSNAQVAGSIITYIRRYSLAAILGMYADEDQDGNNSPNNTPVAKSKQPEVVKPKPEPTPERKAEVEEFAEPETTESNDDGYECTCPEACIVDGHPLSEGVLIPASVIDGIKTPWDALDKITNYSLMAGLGKKVLEVITKFDKKWDTKKDINDITETRVIKIVNELTGVKYDKEAN